MDRPTICFVGVLLIFFVVCLPPAGAEDRFADNGDGTVTDHLLGLMWARADNQGDADWKQAVRWARLTFPDTIQRRYDDWRLPTLAELQSLYVRDASYPGYETDCGQWVRITPQIRLTCGWVWTSEERPPAPTAVVFDFGRGVHYTDRKANRRAYRILPVRTLTSP
jgi:hypothetical protein